MNRSVQHRSWQHGAWQPLLALLSVLAVLAGSAPHESVPGRGSPVTPGLAPAPLPELRASVSLPPLVPHEVGDLPAPTRHAPVFLVHGAEPAARPRAGFVPRPRAQSGVRQVAGG